MIYFLIIFGIVAFVGLIGYLTEDSLPHDITNKWE